MENFEAEVLMPTANNKKDHQIRLSIWLDKDLHDRFNRLHPSHGAFSTFIRRAMHAHVDRLQAQGKALLED